MGKGKGQVRSMKEQRVHDLFVNAAKLRMKEAAMHMLSAANQIVDAARFALAAATQDNPIIAASLVDDEYEAKELTNKKEAN